MSHYSFSLHVASSLYFYPHLLQLIFSSAFIPPQAPHTHTAPPLLFTCLCEIPMQLPILYSMSSSGEATLALHGWHSTFLQNCIVVSQPEQGDHCRSLHASVSVCMSVCITASDACGLPVTYILQSLLHKAPSNQANVGEGRKKKKKKKRCSLRPQIQLSFKSQHGRAYGGSALEGRKSHWFERGRAGREHKTCLSL